jgi:hypothetical protein
MRKKSDQQGQATRGYTGVAVLLPIKYLTYTKLYIFHLPTPQQAHPTTQNTHKKGKRLDRKSHSTRICAHE